MILPASPARPAKRNSRNRAGISWGEATQGSEIKIASIEKVINKLLLELPNLVTVAVVEVATGNCLAHLSRSPGFEAAAVASHNAALVREKQEAMAALRMRGERLTDILIPFRKQLHLIRVAKGGQWFGYLAVETQHTSLALAREILQSIIT